ncbi:MAG: asparagine synthase (glutamine-hydrolyzing) [Gemmatimonadaceae bacterium]|nr:asparagine synthase (glutamine-hydrolyzing) [Gemmatimonadaceae bacterium]
MCGLCGIALPRGSTRRLDRGLLESMMGTIVHRGPDGSGLYLDNGIGLGHRRLSIVDPALGAQPMAVADGAVQIVYNGEVYNHPALMPALQAEGVRYRTHCDTETILHLYLRHGRDVPRRLRGMFAFAIWDARSRELLLARDRFGVKPLYYVHAPDGALYFASEIKALLAAGAVRAALNLPAFPDYLANHGTSGADTLFEGVKRLPPGHTLTWRDGTIDIERYWSLSFSPGAIDTRPGRVLVDEYRERFRESVRLRLMADVPLGMFLSGGIDSASITAMMSTLVDEPIRTFSVAFAEREANELAYARLVAERYRTDHHETVVTPDEFFAALPRMVWHEDEPIAHPSSIALYFVSRLAAERVKVVLTGEGSDETLGGYGRYRYTVWNMALGRLARGLTGSLGRRIGAALVDRLPSGSRWQHRLRRTALTRPASLDDLYFDNFAVFDRAGLRGLLAPEHRETLASIDPYAVAHDLLRTTDAGSLLNQLLHVDLATYLHELLMKQDQMSMAASIESRVPFLDHPLVEFTATLPERLKLRGRTTKYVLREAMRDWLPPEILSRRKMGFPVPVGQWFRNAYRPVIDEMVLGDRARSRGLFDSAFVRAMVGEHQAGVRDHSERLWSLVNVEAWHRVFIDGEAPDQVDLTDTRVSTGQHVPA